MDRNHDGRELHKRSQLLTGVLTVLFGVTVTLAILCTSVGTAYGRYMTTGTAAVSFLTTAKPAATVTVIESATAGGLTNQQTFDVTCDGAAVYTGVRIRIYGTGDTEQVLTVHTTDTKEYTLAARRLDPQTTMGSELGATWVYVFTDETGTEILFEADSVAKRFVVSADSDISRIQIRAEAVKK